MIGNNALTGIVGALVVAAVVAGGASVVQLSALAARVDRVEEDARNLREVPGQLEGLRAEVRGLRDDLKAERERAHSKGTR